MKTIVLSHTVRGLGKLGYKAVAKEVPGEYSVGETIPEAVGGLIRIIYNDLDITEDDLQTGVGLGHNWDELSPSELYYLIVRDLRLLSIEGP